MSFAKASEHDIGQPSIRFLTLSSEESRADSCHLLLIFYMASAVPKTHTGILCNKLLVFFFLLFWFVFFPRTEQHLFLVSCSLSAKLTPCQCCCTFLALFSSSRFFEMDSDLENDINIHKKGRHGAPQYVSHAL